MGKRFLALCLSGLFVWTGTALGADAPAFRITPEGAALLKERGSVGYLYWGTYQDC